MSKVYFTSDLHFNHKNLCNGLRHMSPEESNNLIISNWNKLITKKDTVYILGDVTMEDHNSIDLLLQLKGQKVIVGGNHDVKKCCIEYPKFGIPVIGALQYKGFLCTHIPIHSTQLTGFIGNIHGHIHLSGIINGIGEYMPPKLEGPYYNVNTEFHNYTPVLFDDIKQYFIENQLCLQKN